VRNSSVRKRIVATITAGLLAALVVMVAPGSASASGSTLVLDSFTSSIYGGFSSTDSGSTWSSYPSMQTGVNAFFGDQYRWAFELPLSALPTDATVTSAILQLRTSREDMAGQTAVVGYSGDGVVTIGDADVVGPQVLFTPADPGYNTVDVTAMITVGARSAGYVGFSLRQSPSGSTYCSWDSPENGNQPILTIAYTTPDSTTRTSTPSTPSTTTTIVASGGEVVPAFTG
jgi:hypothetical protein